jgi:small-conductance mechanosensitive channel
LQKECATVNNQKINPTVLALLGVLVLAILIFIAQPPVIAFIAEKSGVHLARIFSVPLFHLGTVGVSLTLLLKVGMFLLFLFFAAHRVRKFLEADVLPHTSLDLGQQDAFARMSAYLVFLLGLVIGLQTMGVNLSSLLVLGGAVGIGVGFGLQTIASNFVSGLILLVERPIKLGDRVEVGGTNGDVVRMAARSTWIRTNENVVIIVPNSEFVAHRITNWTANDRQVRFSIPVGVSYDSSPEQVRDILLKVALAHPDVLAKPAPDVCFMEFGDSSLNFELRVWTIRQVQTPQVLISDLLFAIFRAFREFGIEIPFPQRDLHVRSVAVPIPISNSR